MARKVNFQLVDRGPCKAEDMIEACGGLVRYRVSEDDAGYPDGYEADYYARGVGWVSYEAARSSWTAQERRAVDAWRQRMAEGISEPAEEGR